MRPGNLLLLSLTLLRGSCLLPLLCTWCFLKGCAGAAEHQDAPGFSGKELPGEVQHKSRTRGSLAKPALCCHTPGLQINVGARGQAGRHGGNRSVAHRSKLGQQQGGCWKFHQKHWVSSGSVTARPNVAWSSWDLLAQEWKWEHGLRLSHNTKSKKKLNQPY